MNVTEVFRSRHTTGWCIPSAGWELQNSWKNSRNVYQVWMLIVTRKVKKTKRKSSTTKTQQVQEVWKLFIWNQQLIVHDVSINQTVMIHYMTLENFPYRQKHKDNHFWFHSFPEKKKREKRNRNVSPILPLKSTVFRHSPRETAAFSAKGISKQYQQ